jgi:hypothetical protein
LQRRQQSRLYAALLMLMREPGQPSFTTRSYFVPPSEYGWAAWPQQFGAPLGPYAVIGSDTAGRFIRQFANGTIYVQLAQITDQMSFTFTLPTAANWSLRSTALGDANLPALIGPRTTGVTYRPALGTNGPDTFVYGAACDAPAPSLDCDQLAVFGVRVNSPAGGQLCGDGLVQPPEQCDFVLGIGANFGTYADGVGQCSAYDPQFTGGNLICTPGCTISTAGCD